MRIFAQKLVKFIVVTALVFSFALGAVACGQPEPEPTPLATPTPKPTPSPTPVPETSMTRIQDRGELIVAVEAAHPPYIYVKRVGGEFEIQGPEIELAKALAKDLGVTLVVKHVKFGDIFVGLNMGLYDIALSDITPTPALQNEVAFTTSYFVAEYPIIIRAEDAEKYVDYRSFKDENLGVIKKTPQVALVKDQLWYPDVKQWETEPLMIDKLLTGYFEAVCMEAYRARFYINKYPELTYSGIAVADENATGKAMALAKDKPDLLAYVNSVMAKLEEDDFMLKKLGISETDYDKISLDIDTACADYLGILYGK